MRHIISIVVFSVFMGLSLNAWTADDSWTNVFKFQSKMAQNGSVNAQYILGEMYEEGRGVTKNYSKAFEWYKKARDNGHKKADSRIAKLKQKIADEKLAKRRPAKPEKVIKKTAKKKALVIPAKTAVKKVEPKKPLKPKAPTKLEVNEYVHKPNAPIASPDDLERGKGTHLDDSEDPFD